MHYCRKIPDRRKLLDLRQVLELHKRAGDPQNNSQRGYPLKFSRPRFPKELKSRLRTENLSKTMMDRRTMKATDDVVMETQTLKYRIYQLPIIATMKVTNHKKSKTEEGSMEREPSELKVYESASRRRHK